MNISVYQMALNNSSEEEGLCFSSETWNCYKKMDSELSHVMPLDFPLLNKSYRLGKLLWNYTGNYRENIPEMVGLMSLAPTDIFKMNDLYNENGVIFVGYTPEFGNLPE